MIHLNQEQGRREIFRRIQVGIAGLAGVLLLVGLTEFVIDNVRREAALKLPDFTSMVGEGSANVAAPAQNSEPLADLGVTPDAGQAPAVPDLEPDPRLQKRMDRDPRQPPR